MNFNYSMIERDNTNAENMKVITGPHAFELLDKLMLAYYEKKPPYDKIILPQSLKPKSLEPSGEYYGTEEHVMYFWNVCSYMSGRIKSDLAFKKTTEIFNNHPELFSCKNLADTDVEKIENILKQHNLGRQNKVASHWIDNAKKLIERFDGDPRNIFEIAKNYEDCVSMIKNDGSGENGFLGFREKMTSMILYFLIDEGLIPKIDFPVPVDFHVLRVSLATKMVSTEPRDVYRTNGKIEDALRQLFKKYIQERQVCSLDLTNAVWLLSSTMCNQNYGQLSDKQISEKGVSFLFKELDTNDIRHGENWHRTCGKCAIESYCKYFIPAGPYYRSSAIRPIEKPSGNFIKQIEIDDIDKNNG